MIFRIHPVYVIFMTQTIITTPLSIITLVYGIDVSSCPLESISLTQLGDDLISENFDLFGKWISLSNTGDVLAVGAEISNNYNVSDSGSVTVFQRVNGNEWIKKGLTIYGENSFDRIVSNVLSGDGNIIAIGASRRRATGTGYVRVYQFDGSNWEQMGSDINGLQDEDLFGDGLTFSNDGTILAIGAQNAGTNNEGQVRVFRWNTQEWEQMGTELDGEGTDAGLKVVSLSYDGTILAVGEPWYDFASSTDVGRVRIYQFVNNDWEQVGQDLLGDNAEDRFGYSIVLSPNGKEVTVAATPYFEDNQQGYVTTNIIEDDNTWVRQGNTLFSDESGSNEFGNSIAISYSNDNGKFLVVGSPYYNLKRGLGQVFYLQNDNWNQISTQIEGEEINQKLGRSVAISKDGSTIAIGGEGSESATVHGIVKVFQVDCGSITMSTTDPSSDQFVSSLPVPGLSTHAPSSSREGILVSETFEDVYIEFEGAKRMLVSDIRRFEALTESWYNQYFVDQSIDLGIEQFITYIVVTNQSLTKTGNEIVYDQTLTYFAVDDNVDPESFVFLPFLDRTAKQEYGRKLVDTLDPFADLIFPVAIPQLTKRKSSIDTPAASQSPKSSSNTALIGAIVGAVIFVILVAVVGFVLFKMHGRNSKNSSKTGTPINPTVSDIDQTQVHERPNPPPLNSVGEHGPGFKDQTRSTSSTGRDDIGGTLTTATPQEPVGILLNQNTPDYKDQVRDNPMAVAEAIPDVFVVPINQ